MRTLYVRETSSLYLMRSFILSQWTVDLRFKNRIDDMRRFWASGDATSKRVLVLCLPEVR